MLFYIFMKIFKLTLPFNIKYIKIKYTYPSADEGACKDPQYTEALLQYMHFHRL